MKMNIKLSPRLALCAEFVPEGASLADIGTDHGYLPIFLLKVKKIESALACDINSEPLNSAKNNAEKYGVKIKTILSNGFEKLQENDFNCAVIAGMGGELISEIIKSCSYIQSKTLVLQAMSKVNKLREFLHKQGFEIKQEQTVLDKGKVYSVMLVRKGAWINPCYYMGKIKPDDTFAKEYAQRVVNDLENCLKGNPSEDLVKKISEIRRVYLDENT